MELFWILLLFLFTGCPGGGSSSGGSSPATTSSHSSTQAATEGTVAPPTSAATPLPPAGLAGATSSILPGPVTLVSPAYYAASLIPNPDFAPYVAPTPTASGSSSSLGRSSLSRSQLLQATSLGVHMMIINDYYNKHPKMPDIRVNPQPSSIDPDRGQMVQIIDRRGVQRKIHFSGNKYRLASLASSISSLATENTLSSLPQGNGLTNSATSSPNLNSITANTAITLPKIGCDDTDFGVGLRYDATESGAYTAAVPSIAPLPVGIISNFEYPLKHYATCIKEQGQRGTCTAFSTVGAMETVINAKYNNFQNGTPKYNTLQNSPFNTLQDKASCTNLSVNLSEQALYFHGKAQIEKEFPDVDGYDANDYLNNFVTPPTGTPAFILPFENSWDYNPSWYMTGDSQNNFSDACDHYSENCSISANQGRAYCTDFTTSYPLHCGYLSGVSHTNAANSPDLAGATVMLKNSILGTTGSIQGDLTRAAQYLNGIDPNHPHDGMTLPAVPIILEAQLSQSFECPNYGGYVAEPNTPCSVPDTNGNCIPTGSISSCATIAGGHSMLMVGYIPTGDASDLISAQDMSTSDGGVSIQSKVPSLYNASLKVPGNGGYFIIRNSWGPSFSDSGYIYVSSHYLAVPGTTTALLAVRDVNLIIPNDPTLATVPACK